MFLPGEDAEESPENRLESVLPFLGWKRRNRRLLTDDQLKFGDKASDQPPVRSDGLPDSLPPVAHLLLALAQDLADQGLERLRQSAVGNFPLVLVKLPGNEQTAHQDNRFLQLIYNRRLANA